ncbi:MAG TPA: TonB-dependent receptor plug domain-containing protein [Gemmatimonadaceae bacterium]|nr:TonB-dependent receptor plug domain-containing protein [Gemmatimonadaceae bacterium]
MRSSIRVRVLVGAMTSLTLACHSANARPKAVPEPEVTSRDIEESGGDAIAQAIQSKASGVTVTTTPDGRIAVQIRGPSSFYGSSEPLYVIDDVPMGALPGGVLTGINPHDIESIRVLKNPEDTAVYGVRGANGVIVVRTRKPGRSSNP